MSDNRRIESHDWCRRNVDALADELSRRVAVRSDLLDVYGMDAAIVDEFLWAAVEKILGANTAFTVDELYDRFCEGDYDERFTARCRRLYSLQPRIGV